MNYKLRITTLRDDEKLKDTFKTYKYLCVFETSQQAVEHYHFNIIVDDVKKLRNLVNRVYGSGGSVYNCKCLRDDAFEYNRYLMKDLDIVYNNLFSEQEIELFKIAEKDFSSRIKKVKETFTESIVNSYVEGDYLDHILNSYTRKLKGFDERVIYQIYNLMTFKYDTKVENRNKFKRKVERLINPYS